MTTRRPKPKPGKPKFPLWLHSTGQWAKVIGGRFYYFGTDKDEALRGYLKLKADLEAGRGPRKRRGEITVAELCNEFLTEKQRRVDSGELMSLGA